MNKRISGTGCCLVDYLYVDIRLNGPPVSDFLSHSPGDGGLELGKLVFSRDLAFFSKMSEEECLERITGGNCPDASNLGGPGVVALVHASQVLGSLGWECTFFGALSNDPGSRELNSFLSNFPLKSSMTKIKDTVIPSTIVLSDPTARDGAGERTFISRLGSADLMSPEYLKEDFWDASLFLWGGTALVPLLHDNLTPLLEKAHNQGGINVVGTVYDFRNESTYPHSPWPLGGKAGSLVGQGYPFIDLLITDYEEALRLSGAEDQEGATAFLMESGCDAFIITRGSKDSLIFSHGKMFKTCEETFMPVCASVDRDLENNPHLKGDTTGCGDNFMGGVLCSLARQLDILEGTGEKPDLLQAVAEGTCAGGLALYSKGGCFQETYDGEKKERVKILLEEYLQGRKL